ncbi:uncharacterized protein LOC112683020 [Sipha flava]|uniref:Uncharacterized protein LOC112683020 n=1 Tax=Sipha flava TaxID=143950 RepID=A0A8B8FGJ6_9HEMI|nr:uncharacterized protein LOC112683020 [Sipha flava]
MALNQKGGDKTSTTAAKTVGAQPQGTVTAAVGGRDDHFFWHRRDNSSWLQLAERIVDGVAVRMQESLNRFLRSKAMASLNRVLRSMTQESSNGDLRPTVYVL